MPRLYGRGPLPLPIRPVPGGSKIPAMSGPVWKRLRLEGTCDSCGVKASELLAVGIVVDFAFRPDFRYCPACYEKYKGRHDELHPQAVADQQTPGLISRPDAVSDLPD